MSDPAVGGAGDQPVVVVTGGGAGIGAAVAEQLGRDGWFVVTVDPLVTLDGSGPVAGAEPTTADRIVAAGGSARASSASVTDRSALVAFFADLVAERGRLDAVVNSAGISRPTSYATGSEDDWRAVLSVHLDGYLNVLHAALPIMAAAGRGRILGVTSGSGWRQANAGAYGCAKRAVAALTWQLGAVAPAGVVVNAMSPIAVTRMVTAALGRAPASSSTAATAPATGSTVPPAGSSAAASAATGSAATGGLALGSMPTPESLGPTAAHLVGEGFSWCSGQVVFVGGSEVAVVDPPRLLEVVRTDEVASLAHLLEAVTAGALAPAEVAQFSGGGSNPRFGPIPAEPPTDELPASAVRTCAVVSDRPDVAAAILAALEARGVATSAADPADVVQVADFGGASSVLATLVDRAGPVDAIVIALGAAVAADPVDGAGWEQALAEHDGLVAHLHTDAAWVRAVADHAASTDHAIRLVVLTDARNAAGRSRAQVSAQLARAARKATKDRVTAFAVSHEGAGRGAGPMTGDGGATGPVGEVVAHLLCSPASPGLAGAELVVDHGWFGLRSHPRPSASITFGGPDLPTWFDDALRQVAFTT